MHLGGHDSKNILNYVYIFGFHMVKSKKNIPSLVQMRPSNRSVGP